MSSVQWNEREVTLLDLLDRALDKDVILWGDVTLSVAGVDLVYVGLKVLLSSVETAERMRNPTVARNAKANDPVEILQNS
jgi:hypothetical protein